MFTGIIEAQGRVERKQEKDGDLMVTISSHSLDYSDVKLGDSIAVNGVCLTVVAQNGNAFDADISNETLSYTRWSDIQVGETVNLEKALMPTSRLGGHIVSGHVDGIGEVMSRQEDARSIRFLVKAPQDLDKYIAHKGSITVDGISLTVNKVTTDGFELNIVPHTAKETTLYKTKPGDKVHLEVDVIARYLERLINPQQTTKTSHVSEAFLAEHGFLG
ncbi:riboflavin synthase [Bermanella marisrubri]|uniref:Riboflavin synthase n=1 Tax=Bermanella marisrubri TaxID=207949 RepID=Q1N2N6_9GAMM|nr:riboflavin synthase [Bermanella marisrubri]EAT12371.1 riboflavin synthase subunit alpha [Oceanobacter sp. RED65] [Bermanella marisrubri]QIZ85454.1 riboflavin synthase [Bermanella marisrubri]